jgi:hypothetical protein
VAAIEPLPDIDFNIRAGNTLVGFATYDEVDKAVHQAGDQLKMMGVMEAEDPMVAIDQKAQDVDRLYQLFRQQQTTLGGEVRPEDKAELRRRLDALNDELDRYLAKQYGVDADLPIELHAWRTSHQPFHWFVEFYGVLKEGGFDVIIGNPPYLYLGRSQPYQLIGYTTLKTRNLYSLILEHCMKLISDTGRQGYIVPVSSIATEGYLTLQHVITERRLIFSSYDDRPSHLFDGLDKNTLSILLLAEGVDDLTAFSTRLCRWNAEERPSLFQTLEYQVTPKCRLPGCLPKIGSEVESAIWTKIWSKDKSVSLFASKKGKFPVYYSRKVNSFLQILDFVPEVRDGAGNLRPPSEFKELRFSSAEQAAAVYCCFSSTLFRWFMDVVSDGSHVNRREVDNFPFDPTSEDLDLSQLESLAQELTENLKATSEKRTMRYSHDTLTVQCIIPKYSKPIIDEIDRVLAQHYGFTDEELDFILNYDIKYRMGDELFEDDET